MDEDIRKLIDADLKGELNEADRDRLAAAAMDDSEVFAALQSAEAALSKGLLAKEDFAPVSGFLGGWRASAASLVAGFAAALLVARFIFAPVEMVSMSSSAYELYVQRSATSPQSVPIGPRDEFVTLMLYPVSDGYDAWDVRLEARQEGSDGADGANTWSTVWESRSPVGGQDALALTLPRETLRPGLYRVSVAGVQLEPPGREPNIELTFRTTFTD